MWDLKLRSESKITPRLVTSDLIQGVNFPRLLNSISLFVLGPTSKVSVLSSFNFKKLLLINLFITRRQVIMEFKLHHLVQQRCTVVYYPHNYGNIHCALWWCHQVAACIVRIIMDQGSSLVEPQSSCHVPQTHDLQDLGFFSKSFTTAVLKASGKMPVWGDVFIMFRTWFETLSNTCLKML